MLFRDDINKIIYVTSHKCGCSTISTFLAKLYGLPLALQCDYNAHVLKNNGYCTINESHKNYFKILILRDPFKRFFSALYEDCTSVHKSQFEHINLNIIDFLYLLCEIKNCCVQPKNKTVANLISIHNKLFTHIRTQKFDMSNDFELFNKYGFKFDKIIDIANFHNEMVDIKYNIFGGNISIPSNIKNSKKYIKVVVDVNTLLICDLCSMTEFPDIFNFETDEIRTIIKDIYQDDYNLIENFLK